MALLGSLVVFLVFGANVVLGSFAGAPFLTDVQEMLTLLVSSVLFVIAILKREAVARQAAASQGPKGGEDIG